MSGVFMRLATIWAALVLLWALILSVNVPGVWAHGGWFALLIAALGPMGAVAALTWAVRGRK